LKYFCQNVENIIIIYPDRSEFSRQFSIVHFCCQKIDAKLLCPLNIHGSAFVLYKLLYRSTITIIFQ
jgi:hypothetical protein